ncbi:OLC1v1000327C1 [Oldenlandia corymbosa var. corymbosa]|uniref:OLC1v1000327C1 n=1 Tax=Oldenlandia corymbosa var. corymbosa TaxID=529605 RepID=A0AAV1D2H3_OLDCO|nr:OLC1v1000327C1 [Oldenlandia corymbosa var. corymbosa]
MKKTLFGHHFSSALSLSVPPAVSSNRFCTIPFSQNINPSSMVVTAKVAPQAGISTELTSQSKSSLSVLSPLEAILFDIDGTLCDSDPLHYDAFREMLQEVGFNGGQPITEDFFVKNISGMHNDELCHVLFPEWDFDRAMKFMEDKEAMFRRLAAEELKPVKGLDKLCQWVEERGLKRAAVTNAPRPNAELILSMLGLNDFFELLVIGSECDRAKPFPDPYLKALDVLKVSPEHAFVFEDSISGIKAGVSAGMPVVGVASRNPETLLMATGATLVIRDFEDSNLWGALADLEARTRQ